MSSYQIIGIVEADSVEEAIVKAQSGEFVEGSLELMVNYIEEKNKAGLDYITKM